MDEDQSTPAQPEARPRHARSNRAQAGLYSTRKSDG